MKRYPLIGAALIALAALALAAPAMAQHFAAGQGAGNQLVVTHPDVTIAPAAAAVDVCGGANASRVTAVIQNTGAGGARVGDSNSGASQGEMLSSGASTAFDATGAIYAYSAAGTTIACTEVTR